MSSTPTSVISSPFDTTLEAPLGKPGMCVVNGALRELAYLSENTLTVDSSDALIARLAHQLDAYYIDTCTTFDISLTPAGIDFQLCVWQTTSAVPCGSVITYDATAQRVDSVPRAVGQVCGDNWLLIPIPCHHMVSASGIDGFSYHTDGRLLNIKHWSLRREDVMPI